MAKIKEVHEFTKSNGKKGWRFILDDGKEGFISNDKPWEYKEGQEVSYTLAVKKKSNGEEYNIFTFGAVGTPVTQQSASTPQSSPPTPNLNIPRAPVKGLTDLKFEGKMKCLQLAHDTYLAGKLDDNEAKNHCREWVVLADALIDDLAK